MGNRGHNGRVENAAPRDRTPRNAADLKKIQAAEDAKAFGAEALRTHLQPGCLVRLAVNATVSTAKAGSYIVLNPIACGVVDDATLRRGALLMMIKLERISSPDGIRRPCYTFLQMGSMLRCTVSDMTMIEPA